MGYEEDSEIAEDNISRISKDIMFEIQHPVCKDVISSGKVRFTMKNKPKVKVFALVMCAVMAISSMAVLAGYTSGTLGATSQDRAAISLRANTYDAHAYTSPEAAALDCSTSVTAYGEIRSYTGYGAMYAYTEVQHSQGANRASSTHQAGAYYGTLSVAV